ncbi:ECF transporter S component [Anaerocolumna xylanovorans]|uniref:Niacin transporter n=1 Tax=Anaerocolumna xylanovorans DSM 12503 TaxID=1121345 RepID=A0A1M7Y970_9FIRM|nr:ECF transporter S component [Anaerocolumna xylanovorans]SHO49182.1 niacin transporter [Anaerocolumna xylanovorans DSM 12503]
MNTKNSVQTMTIAALLSAIAILIPMFAPKFVLEPASYTLASHVPIFIAMFISPYIAVAVAIITTIGFLMAGIFPIVVVLRALSHVVFAIVGAIILKKNKNLLNTVAGFTLFGLLTAAIHAVCEVAVVTFFYWGNNLTDLYYNKGYLFTVILLVGVGTIVHSMIDFTIAYFIWKPLQKIVTVPVSVRISKSEARF